METYNKTQIKELEPNTTLEIGDFDQFVNNCGPMTIVEVYQSLLELRKKNITLYVDTLGFWVNGVRDTDISIRGGQLTWIGLIEYFKERTVQNTPKKKPSESQQTQGVKSSDLGVQRSNVL